MIRWVAPGPYDVAFTTRVGGVSEGPFDSLNLGLLTEDDPANVTENRRLACAEMGLDLDRLAMNRQVHGSTVRRAERSRGDDGDGLWTEERGQPLLALAADCLPIVLARAAGPPALAVLHAGRIGLLQGIIEAGTAALGGGRDLVAVTGPSIGVCCYEVGEDVSAPYRARFGAGVLANGHLDLRAVADRLLREAGVERIDHVEHCTACRQDLFFSHRRDGARTGRQGVLAAIA